MILKSVWTVLFISLLSISKATFAYSLIVDYYEDDPNSDSFQQAYLTAGGIAGSGSAFSSATANFSASGVSASAYAAVSGNPTTNEGGVANASVDLTEAT